MKKSKVALPDTNTILRYLLKDVPDQFETVHAFFEQVRSGSEKAIILECVLVECLYIFTKFYQVKKEEAVLALAGLLSYKGVMNPDKAVLTEALHIYVKANLGMVDCMLLARARHLGAAIFTFDKKLRNISETGDSADAARKRKV